MGGLFSIEKVVAPVDKRYTTTEQRVLDLSDSTTSNMSKLLSVGPQRAVEPDT